MKRKAKKIKYNLKAPQKKRPKKLSIEELKELLGIKDEKIKTEKNNGLRGNKICNKDEISNSNKSQKVDKEYLEDMNNHEKELKEANSIKKELDLNGLIDKEYLSEKLNILDINNFKIAEIEPDGNCGYSSISLQLYGSQEYHYLVRNHIYTFLYNNNNYEKIN